MQKIVNCELSIKRVIGDKDETSVIKGKGYFKEDNGETVVFFSNEEAKYKYVYNNGLLEVFCNDSKYTFKENVKDFGEIKSGEYIFKITTLASKIEVMNNCIVLDYSLYQQDMLIGTYYSRLSFN